LNLRRPDYRGVRSWTGHGIAGKRPADSGKNRKKTEKKAERGLHFPESMIYYLFITLQKQGVRFIFERDDVLPT